MSTPQSVTKFHVLVILIVLTCIEQRFHINCRKINCKDVKPEIRTMKLKRFNEIVWYKFQLRFRSHKTKREEICRLLWDFKKWHQLEKSRWVFTIYPDHINGKEVYCDMTTSGGGWTVRVDVLFSRFIYRALLCSLN